MDMMSSLIHLTDGRERETERGLQVKKFGTGQT